MYLPKQIWKMLKFLFELPDGEDEKTMAFYATRMQKLHRLSKYNQDKLLNRKLMDLTFFKGRIAIINPNPNPNNLEIINATVDTYPKQNLLERLIC